MTDDEPDIHDIHDSPPSGGTPSAASQSIPSSVHDDDTDDEPITEDLPARICVSLGELEVEVEGDDLDDVQAVFDEEMASTIDMLTEHHDAIREMSKGYY